MTKKPETPQRPARIMANDADTDRAIRTGVPADVLSALAADQIDNTAVVDACIRAGFNAQVAELFTMIVRAERQFAPLVESAGDIESELKQAKRHYFAIVNFQAQTVSEAVERSNRLQELEKEISRLERHLCEVGVTKRYLWWLRSYGRALFRHLPEDTTPCVNSSGAPPPEVDEWFAEHKISPWELDSWKLLNRPPARKRRAVLRTVERPREREPRHYNDR